MKEAIKKIRTKPPTKHICADCGFACDHESRPLDRKKNRVCPLCGSPYCSDQCEPTEAAP